MHYGESVVNAQTQPRGVLVSDLVFAASGAKVTGLVEKN
jgi:hypothetical protein